MNFSANILGLDNAATPLGLKAMQGLQELNPNKEKASNAQIMFLTLNASGLTIVPVSIMAARFKAGATNPADVFVPILLATFFSTIAGFIAVSIKQRINLFNKYILWYLGSAIALVSATLFYFASLSQEELKNTSSLIAAVILFSLIVGFILYGMIKKINVYEAFIEGAKEGFESAIRIIAYLIAIYVAITLFRTCGAMDWLMNSVKYFMTFLDTDLRFVDALPTALMKPLSGGGARGMMIDSMNTYGADSFAGRLSCIFQGAADTTFYIITVYFGYVGVKNTRYALATCLIADLVGVIAAIFIAYIFFG
jgi:spore maturation protein SpmB